MNSLSENVQDDVTTGNDDIDSAIKPGGRQFREHTYFLDRDMAYAVAMQQNNVERDGQQVLQYCYYDGEAFNDGPDNLINVKVESFTEFFAGNDLPLPTFLCLNNDELSQQEAESIQTSFAGVLEEVIQLRSEIANSKSPQDHKDTYFFDAGLALQIAQQQNRVYCGHPTIDGLQICYYDGEPLADTPDNLINLKFENSFDYLATTRYRMPKTVVFPATASDEQRQQITELFQRVLDEVESVRQHITQHNMTQIRNQTPVWTVNEPLRVFMPASRLTTVMQYATNNLAKAFRKLDHEAYVSIEQNDMEQIDNSIRLTEMNQFSPHVTVNINHRNNDYLNPGIFNVTWWQDSMPELRNQQPVHWRERDFVYSAVPQLDSYLEKCGATNIERQSFCIDLDEFKLSDEIERENKIVFAGSSYLRHLKNVPNTETAIKVIAQHFEAGEPITSDLLKEIAAQFNMPYDYVFWHLFHYVVRDYSVRWVCENSDIPVEVYGPDWQYDERVRPFYKGILKHGDAITKLYNSARYVLVSHPFEIHSQRLAEAAACGAIPVVYDCRHSSDLPHWDDELVYYRTREDLHNILSNNIGEPVVQLAQHYSYESFARKIIRRIESML